MMRPVNSQKVHCVVSARVSVRASEVSEQGRKEPPSSESSTLSDDTNELDQVLTVKASACDECEHQNKSQEANVIIGGRLRHTDPHIQ